MSRNITIQGTVIPFPVGGTEQDWSEAVVDFAVAVENALNFAIGTYDIPPQVFSLDSLNPGTLEVTNLAFPISQVRSAVIGYSVARTADGPLSAVESGEIFINYDENRAGAKWYLNVERLDLAGCDFTISDDGQVSITTTALGVTGHQGKMSFSAKTLTQS